MPSIIATHRLHLDVKNENRLTKIHKIVQFDNVLLIIKFYNDGEMINTSHVTSAKISHLLPNGKVVVGDAEVIGENFLYRYKGSEMENLGVIKGTLTVTGMDGKLTSKPFFFEVVADLMQLPHDEASEMP